MAEFFVFRAQKTSVLGRGPGILPVFLGDFSDWAGKPADCRLRLPSKGARSMNLPTTVNVEEFSVHRVPPMPCIQNRKTHTSSTNPLYTEV